MMKFLLGLGMTGILIGVLIAPSTIKVLKKTKSAKPVIEYEYIAPAMWRYKVYKGWIVKTTTADGVAMIYIEDEKHEWKIGK